MTSLMRSWSGTSNRDWEKESRHLFMTTLLSGGGTMARLKQEDPTVAKRFEPELWKARRSLSPSLARKAPNKLGEDISVPLSQVPEVIKRIKEISKEHGLPVVIFGHIGDGNLHPNILFDKRDKHQWVKAQEISKEIFTAALNAGGTLSGEHGIGMLKRDFMVMALGEKLIAIQKGIKRIFDPQNILNPGKILPD